MTSVLLAAAAWAVPPVGAPVVLELDQPGSQLGYAVAGAGDVDADGFDDVLAAAIDFDGPFLDCGQVSLWTGTPYGIATSPAWSVAGDEQDSQLGISVSGAGDLNGDGFADVAIGTPLEDDGGFSAGAAWVYLGSGAGLGASAAWSVAYPVALTWYGTTVASAGDVDGDGFDELLVGALFYSNGESSEGAVFLYAGSALGPSAAPSWTFESDLASAQLGRAASAGDVDGDGYSDAVFGAEEYSDPDYAEGAAFLFLGSATGLGSVAAWTAEGGQAQSVFGASVASAGDVDGDGFDDVLVGSPGYGVGAMSLDGRVDLFLGSAAGLSATPDWTALGVAGSSSLFGYTVGGAGDVDGDGFDDARVTAPGYSNGEIFEGQVSLYRGSAAGLSAAPVWRDESDQQRSYLGYAASAAGDVDADGYADLAVGAFLYNHGQLDEGVVLVYPGSCTGADADGDGIGDSCDACPGFDDLYDPDSDGVAEDCDACPGWNDHVDSDLDTVPDGCDDCPSDADIGQLDSDLDGVGNACDACLDFDDAQDVDGDLVPDGCDACPGQDDRSDGDFDGAPDGCDACPGFDDALDADVDLVADGCDLCPSDADPAQDDADLDGRGDACDACPDFADALDADGDLVPDGCDACPDFADALDADGDLVPDGCDQCAGFDDHFDADLDLVPDGCDVCATGDDAVDVDADGVADACDPCPEIAGGPDLDGDGFAVCSGDCWEGNADVHPGAVEVPDGVDQDCDGRVDEETPWYDDDRDGATEEGGDCDDGDATVGPGAVEVCDGIDQDCNGIFDDRTDCFDDDGDGFTEREGDCADADAAVFPGALELPLDGVDNDCDGTVDPGSWDPDGDGYISADCAPDDAAVHPGAPEVANGVDDDCDLLVDEGTSLADDDGDGFTEEGGDCDDSSSAVYPGAPETGDGRDDDCDGAVDEDSPPPWDDPPPPEEVTSDVDFDGWTVEEGDCNDHSGWANPEQPEVCDGIDNDCDGLVDEACDAPTSAPPTPTSGCETGGGAPGALAWIAVGLLARRRVYRASPRDDPRGSRVATTDPGCPS